MWLVSVWGSFSVKCRSTPVVCYVAPVRFYHLSSPNNFRGSLNNTLSLWLHPPPSLSTKVCYVQVRYYVKAHTPHPRRKPFEHSSEGKTRLSISGQLWYGLLVLLLVLSVYCIFRKKLSRKTWRSIPADVQNSDMQLNKTHEYRILEGVHNKITRQSNEYMNNIHTTIDSVVRDNGKLNNLGIDKELWPFIRHSWENKDPHFLGRLDLYADFEDGEKSVVFMDYNAKKPSFLRESVSIQSDQSRQLEKKIEDQFRSLYIMERINNRADASALPTQGQTENEINSKLHFIVLTEDPEEMWNANYLAERAWRAGFKPVVLKGSQIYWNGQKFIDSHSEPIERIWNPEPWKILKQVGVADMKRAYSAIKWVEPMWKVILEKESILPYLWQNNNLKDAYLPSYFSKEKFIQNKTPYVEISPSINRQQIAVYKEDNTVATIYSVPTTSPVKFPFYHEYIIPPSADSYTKYLAYTWIVGNVTQFVGFQEDNNSHFGPNRVAVKTTVLPDCGRGDSYSIFGIFRNRGSSAAERSRTR